MCDVSDDVVLIKRKRKLLSFCLYTLKCARWRNLSGMTEHLLSFCIRL